MLSSEVLALTLEQLLALEGDDIKLPSLDSAVAWKLGTLALAKAELFPQAILVDVSLANGQVLFHSASKPGASLDNDYWVNRKKKTVFRFAVSSYAVGKKLAAREGATPELALYVDSKEYATHGGSVPIRIDGFDGVLGALTISGLKQEEDHLLALQVLQEAKAQLSK